MGGGEAGRGRGAWMRWTNGGGVGGGELICGQYPIDLDFDTLICIITSICVLHVSL